MYAPPTLPSDRQLVDAARQGHDAAWQELVERHQASLLAVLGSGRRSARRAVIERVTSLRVELVSDARGDMQGDESIRAFRPKAIAAVTGGKYGPLGDSADADRSDLLLARAFGRLPEPWQTVLWHSYVEQLSSAEVSPLVGRATSDVTDLVATAERGLVDAYAIEVLDACDVDDETAAVIPLLSGYVRDALPPHERRRVERHLALADGAPADTGDAALVGSARAREMVALASVLPDALPPAIAPGVTGLSVTEHRERLGTEGRSFGAATLFANRSDRTRQAIVVGSAAAVVMALFGVAYLVGQPFDGNDTVADPNGESAASAPLSPATAFGEEPGSSTSDPAATDASELELRPDASELSNTIEVIVDDGTREVSLRATESPLRTAVSTAAPVFAGGTGTLDLAISNRSADLVEASVELVLPRGVVLDGLASGDAECTDPENDSPFCNVSVAAGETLDLSLRVALESTVLGMLTVEGDTLVEVLEAPIVATKDLIHNSVGRGDALVIGNTVMTCDDDAASELGISCDDVRDGTGEIVNRWDVPMAFTGAAPAFGFANGSSATLDIPADATIVHAQLFWSGDLEERGVRVAAETENVVLLATPSGETVDVEAAELKFGEEDSTQYVGRANVTDLIAAAGPGDYLIGNIASAEVQGSYGAWALVVVFDQDDMPRRHRIITDPFDWVAPQAPFSYKVDMPVPVVSDGQAQLDVVAFEGERGFTPEEFLVGGARVGGDNPFDSTILGARVPAFDNNLGVDIDAYDLTIDTPDGTLGVNATSTRDGIRLAVLVLTVDLDQ